MDKNTILGLLIIAGLLIGYSLFTKPSREEQADLQRVRDSVALAEKIKLQQQQTQQTEQAQSQPIIEDALVKSQDAPVKSLEENRDVYGAFAEGAAGSKEYITLENDKLKLKISTLGGRPYTVELKEYLTHDTLPLILFDGDSTVFGMTFFAQNRTINTNKLFFTPSADQAQMDASNGSPSLSMKLPAGEDRYIEYQYSLEPGSYLVDFKLRFVNMDDLLSANNNYLDLDWNIYVPQQEKGRMNELNYTSIFLKHFQDEVERLSMRSKKDLQEKNIPTKVRWIAFKQQFFSSVFIPPVLRWFPRLL